MNWSASVLTTLSSDTEPTILLTFDSAKYIINAGENTNRAFLQSQQNWKRTRALFFTQIGTQRASGLPGLLMSFADATISKLDIVGPPGLTHFLAAMRMYTYRDTMPVFPVEASWEPNVSADPHPIYQDENIMLFAIPVSPTPLDPSLTVLQNEFQSHESQLKRKRESSPNQPAKRSMISPSSSPDSSSFRELIQQPDFTPDVLFGDGAHSWRKLMVEIMFPGSKEHKNASKKRKALDSRAVGSRSTGKSTSGSKSSKAVKTTQPSTLSENTVPASGPLVPEIIVSAESAPASLNIDDYKRSRLPIGFHKQLPSFTPSTPISTPSHSPTICYVVVGPRVRGKFDIKKAEALGVPFGPLRGQLTKGQTISFSVKVGDEQVERTVRPEECIGESEPPGVVVVLDVPTPSHIKSLISSFANSPFFSKLRSTNPEDHKDYVVRTIFHICGDGVLEDPRYLAFMDGFGTNVQHVVASREHGPDPVTFTSAAFNQLRLNKLDPTMFSIPKFSLSAAKDLTVIPGLPGKTCYMSSNLTIQTRPPGPPVQKASADVGDLFHPSVSSKQIADQHIRHGRQILPLGTGSAIPTKYRNVSSTLIQIPGSGNILLDSGEGTWGQLARQFGTDETSPGTHIHGDHHMGLAKILAQRRSLQPPPAHPLYLVTIRAVHLYLRELSDIQDLGLNDPSDNGIITVMSEALHWRETGAYQTTGMWQIGGDEPWTDYAASRLAARKIFKTVDVYHRTRCYGAVIKHTDDWSIVFSGDTQPTNTLVAAGQRATVLIHEATMADDQVEMAKRKAHSTFGQAVDIGRSMNAEHILLTHFSARYPKVPPSSVNNRPGEGTKEPVIALAFDHANIAIGDMWKMKFYLPAIEQNFSDTVEEDDKEDTNMADIEIDIT
ncbi:hypothetical protein BD779DRAFT_1527626 [Infundibulicybe gibba]|nr:hypothetical protein BD779DRAFT_1527626 [Infundibulicybe gibba]